MSEGVKRKGSDDSSRLMKKKQIARQRWQILARTLKGQSSSETQQSSVSVRRFSTFGLLQTEKVDSRQDDRQEAAAWFSYTCSSVPDFLINVRHVSQTLRPEDLLGFNNTGNVCVWPAEEVMTYYCLQHALDFRDCSILELGGGMTCLTGVAVAASSGAKQVVVSDGNQQSVDNLHKIIEENNFGDTTVSARLLRWGPEPLDDDLQESFDWVLCADCLFFEGREHLSNIIFSALKPGGQALVFAPGRSGTYDLFCDVAEKQFAHVSRRGAHYDCHIQALHSELKGSSDSYKEDLHLPLLVELTKAPDHTASSRDTTPESR